MNSKNGKEIKVGDRIFGRDEHGQPMAGEVIGVTPGNEKRNIAAAPIRPSSMVSMTASECVHVDEVLGALPAAEETKPDSTEATARQRLTPLAAVKTVIQPTPWEQVMAGLVGARLAIYDDLLRGRLVTVATEELRWLQYRWLAWWDADDEQWRHRMPGSARISWERDGACLAAAKDMPAPVPEIVQPKAEEPSWPPRQVHPHQAEVFALEGYSQ